MKRMIKSAKTLYEMETDSISQIRLDIDDLMKRLQYQKSNASTDEQEAAIQDAILYLRRAYNKIR